MRKVSFFLVMIAALTVVSAVGCGSSSDSAEPASTTPTNNGTPGAVKPGTAGAGGPQGMSAPSPNPPAGAGG